jgi:hypothetical protein
MIFEFLQNNYKYYTMITFFTYFQCECGKSIILEKEQIPPSPSPPLQQESEQQQEEQPQQ